MRVTRVFSAAVIAACLAVPATTHVFAGDAAKATAKAKKPMKKRYTVTAPAGAGVARTVDVTDQDGPRTGTVTQYQNELGQTVYSIAASHFDISPPLSELAERSTTAEAIAKEAEALEEEHDSDLQASRPTRSGLPDPVVQRVIGRGDPSLTGDAPFAAAPIGFNFAGIPKSTPSGTAPSMSDCNGSVGNDQFVETVNSRYQVWSLNRATQVATSILGPASLNTLWAGFGGGCETTTYPYGDPVVVYDKKANRWLISKFETQFPPGFCVAISTTANAAGTYYRYHFAIPAGMIFDYPKVGVMQDAYYVSAINTPGGLFVAMDRAKMLAGDPAATWQLIGDPNQFGFLPADLDGFAYPPNKAGGIFVSRHDSDMYIYRMKVNFTTPAATALTLQAVVPLAIVHPPCLTYACMPQPGTTFRLQPNGFLLMFRAAYRNYIDHESLVVSHDADPSISGVVSGARWYEFRLSGTPDATCPAYPCLYQQGTIADMPHGRSRWLPSIAMDGAENVLLGYTTSGKTDGVENHSQRYTGRAKGDPRGLMTVPETTIVTGTGNITTTIAWGDYASMSVDPADDCTFWYVSQYVTESPNSWSTRIVSAAFPAGSGAGQCPPTTCTARPTTTPLINSATVPGSNQITVTWPGVTPTPGGYAIERAEGTCGNAGYWRPLAATSGANLSYTDTTVQGGITYAYTVRSAADASGRCNAPVVLSCKSATATGVCTLRPSFGGATGAASSQASTCGVTVSWTPAVSRCPLTANMRYNVYRGTVPDFVPSPANRIATCVPGPSSYLDSDNLQSGTTYYYVVRAEDSSTGNGGPCGGGNEESNSIVVSATPYAAGMQATPGTWTDGGGDGSAFLELNSRAQFNPDYEWRLVKTSDDPGANHTPGGAYAYRNAGPAAGDLYSSNICGEMRSPRLTAAGTTVNLQYWERHQLEYRRDAVAVEYSVNNGAWMDVPAPSNSSASGCDASDETTGWETLGCTQDPPTNACGYPDTKNALSGPFGSGTSCGDFATSETLTPYAHRCHPITGLTPGDEIRFRWRFASDADSDLAGFYLDDIAVTNVNVPNACVPDTCVGQPNGTACSDGNACTVGDACGGGVCTGTSTAPAETASMTVAADKATYSWSPVASATLYDVVRGRLDVLPVGPGGGDETCFGGLPGPSLVDATIPAGGTGFWYLSRGENDCGPGSLGQRSNGAPRVTTTCP